MVPRSQLRAHTADRTVVLHLLRLRTMGTIAYMHHTCTIHAPYMHGTCTTHAPYMHGTCTIHAPYMHHTCTIHAPFVHPTQTHYKSHLKAYEAYFKIIILWGKTIHYPNKIRSMHMVTIVPMAPFSSKSTSKLRSALPFRYSIVIPRFIPRANTVQS